jgi:RNA polymerase sigma-70 factor (ECF subfamily)
MNIFRKKVNFNKNDIDSVVAACVQNDARARRALINHFYGYVKSISLNYSSNEMDAEEIINDSFLKVFQNIQKYDSNQPFKAWLRKIVVNTSIDAYRKKVKEMDTDEIHEEITFDTDGDVISDISAEEILARVQSLSPSYRMVFILHVIEGYTHKEIAQKLGISEGTSKSNLNDARKKLKALLIKESSNVIETNELKSLPQYE